MSRIGKKPVTVPSGVDVTIDGSNVTVKGSKGELTRDFNERVSFEAGDGELTVNRLDDTRESKALHGLSRALLHNMVVGVTDGFSKELEIQGVGYRAVLKGNNVELQVGFSHLVLVEAPEGITFEVPEPTKIKISGIDKEKVGQVAANIRKVRPPEPYKGRGIRYVGEYVRRKAGKAGK
ncbi:MAG: 50S ribosomal protein L6 [Acidobacteria bacterium]|nr:50S ribosomal protein L6 [Acidobacteriota bacterium]TDI50757.1 MAG: 50S ribosomal protein L6 [Acidobacteriota bacterium]TDI54103.1 MAG: 50S ribosomal protein L6 [Acidobacteriota bacterium]